MAPSLIRLIVSMYGAWCPPLRSRHQRQSPSALAKSAASMNIRTPVGSTAHGFSANTCFPASIAGLDMHRPESRRRGEDHHVNEPQSMTFLYASQPLKQRSSVMSNLSLGRSAKRFLAAASFSGNMSPSATDLNIRCRRGRVARRAPLPRPAAAHQAHPDQVGSRRMCEVASPSSPSAPPPKTAAVVFIMSRLLSPLSCLLRVS